MSGEADNVTENEASETAIQDGRENQQCIVCGKTVTCSMFTVNVADNRQMQLCTNNCFLLFRSNPKYHIKKLAGRSKGVRDANEPMDIEGDDNVGDKTDTSQICAFCGAKCGRVNNGFCSDNCKEKYLSRNDIQCSVCKAVPETGFYKAVLEQNQIKQYCSEACFTGVSDKEVMDDVICEGCSKLAPAQFKVDMDDGTVKKFCSNICAMNFQSTYSVSHASANGATENAEPIRNIPPPQVTRQLLIRPEPPRDIRNCSTQTSKEVVSTAVKGTICKPLTQERGTTGDGNYVGSGLFVPIPVPLYIPAPVTLYQVPVPIAIPLPIPVPVPVFIPVSGPAAESVNNQLQDIARDASIDPSEAELLLMADAAAVSTDNKNERSVRQGPSFNDTTDLELELSSFDEEENFNYCYDITQDPGFYQAIDSNDTHDTLPGFPTPEEPSSDKPNTLQSAYGCNAWKCWVRRKKPVMTASSAPNKAFKIKENLLQCTAQELNASLYQFVKEVRKPNGEIYAPDSIYYLCLGIQQYLFSNGRVDNIFTDYSYKEFSLALNEVLKTFKVKINPEEEEHLWDCKLLGAHSPQVLLHTLIYNNTKYFLLKSTADHLQLAFTNIFKDYNNRGQKKSKGPTCVRYVGNKDFRGKMKEDSFTQAENLDNPLRCPVKLYEFYLSKTPENTKSRNDCFYLVPESSCVPESPVWYSSKPLDTKEIDKMLNRVRLVREIQEVFLRICVRE